MNKFGNLAIVAGLVVLLWPVLGKYIPDDIPDLVPNPAPLESDGFYVLIVEESTDRRQLSQDQLTILNSMKLAEHLDELTDEWRIYDKDVNLDNANPAMVEGMKLVGDKLPWVVISNSEKGGTSEPLPSNLEKTFNLIDKYSGE